MDIETGEVLFEWSSLDHVSPNETALPLPLGQAGSGYNSSTAWDYFHINSITKGSDGNYLLSARHASTIYKINGTDGSIIWRLGGKQSDFELGPNVAFGFQHHARYLHEDVNGPVQVISLFDNSVYGSESAGGGDKEIHLFPYSRGKYIRLDEDSKTATLGLAFLPPTEPILAKSQGSLQTLPGGNALINWGSEGQISEYIADGTPVFHAFLDSGFLQDNLQNYRAFRYNWTGYSPETPAVFAERVSEDEIDVYVSWNGDTQTRTWRFSWEEDIGGRNIPSSKEVTRSGFETSVRLRNSTGEVRQVRVEALDARHSTLTVSESVLVVPAYWINDGTRTEKQDQAQHRMREDM